MTTNSALGARLSAIRALAQGRRLAIGGVLGFVVALAAASQVAVSIPGTPVPLTLQPMVVVLAGMLLGPRLGAASMVLYLAVGALGVPVFAPVGAPGMARFFGPTGGYLLAYPAAAATAGVLARRFPGLLGRWMAAVVGIAVVFLGGLAQLTLITGSVARSVALGVTPFAALDVAKAFVAALIARPRARRAAE